ncbi:MAG TPA: fasciclin domain-containing protein, partial [Agriterribacter sp.]|nr:fasciclin domain-containing protein [Agriterribacter sp.]
FIFQSCEKYKDYLPHGGATKNLSIAAIVSKNPDFSLLKLALQQTGLTEALNKPGALTVFAPDNSAFAAAGFPDETAVKNAPVDILKGILLYHVLGSKITAAQVPVGSNTPVKTLSEQDIYVTSKSGKVSVNGAAVIKADIMASNGVIHVINKVLIPPTGNIVDLVAGNPDFSLLLAAVLRASEGSTNVAGLLSGSGPLTVFAPTNMAFSKAGLSTIESINAANPDDLTAILAYHVVAARVFSTDLVNNAKVPTVNGEKITVKLGNKKAAVEGKSNTSPSLITAADLVTTNGVVHVIDQVLLP